MALHKNRSANTTERWKLLFLLTSATHLHEMDLKTSTHCLEFLEFATFPLQVSSKNIYCIFLYFSKAKYEIQVSYQYNIKSYFNSCFGMCLNIHLFYVSFSKGIILSNGALCYGNWALLETIITFESLL